MGRLNDVIADYAKNNPVRFHMPGHKGKPEYALDYSLDVTELYFTDNLYAPDPKINLIYDLEKRIAKCFFKDLDIASLISCGGATLCIQAAVLALAESKKQAEYIVCDRASHISFVNVISLLGLKPLWVLPGEDFADKLRIYTKTADIAGVFVTSPDYYGAMKDVARISAVCKQRSLSLIVDNSHGSHLAFYGGGRLHPINLGADISIDSIHKTLPALTGAALLHSNKSIGGIKRCMNVFASTSPSFLILQSIEKTVDLLETRGREEHARLIGDILAFRKKAGGLGFMFDTGKFYDPYRIALNCGGAGEALYCFLAGENIFCEFFTEDSVILIPSISNGPEDFDKLLCALRGYARNNAILPAKPDGFIYPPGVPENL